jgi:UDP-N-acetylmuramoyl-L-alanyl-D-glutamate--2,6-diaminopimelate ligase
MTLEELVNDSALANHKATITGLALDSRTLGAGQAFVALAGAKQHGLVHVQQALANGASAVLFDPANEGTQLAAQITQVPAIAIDNLSAKLGEIAARFYGNPSHFMDVIGITGTNGKTSCSQFLSQLLDKCGVIGTLGWGEWGQLTRTLNTTPDALAVQHILATLLRHKNHAVAMEVSSHGLAQGRVNGVRFKGAVFTNISRDHLDYHGTMTAYLQAKLALLKSPHLEFAVINLDDAYSEQIIAAVPESVIRWGVSTQGKTMPSGESLRAENIRHHAAGIEFSVCWRNETQPVSLALYGAFNVENVLCVLAVMLALGVTLVDAARKISTLKAVSGRMECFGGGNQPLVFVDYAHTPDALDNVLSGLKQQGAGDLWVVFGCGGNRDTGKRPLMGQIAEQWADHVVVTDDNPRFEDSHAIANDILAGCRSADIELILCREQAIRHVIARAASTDCILIAGKGHEDYQEINGIKSPFSDKTCVLEALKNREAG